MLDAISSPIDVFQLGGTLLPAGTTQLVLLRTECISRTNTQTSSLPTRTTPKGQHRHSTGTAQGQTQAQGKARQATCNNAGTQFAGRHRFISPTPSARQNQPKGDSLTGN